MTAGQRHPDSKNSDTYCEVNRDGHVECTGWSAENGQFLDWRNPDYVPVKRVKGDRSKSLKDMVMRVASASTVGPPKIVKGA